MPVECYSWQVHPSWIGRGWQTILGSVPGEACETEDPCQWSVTPGRSTKARLVEGDRPYWGQSLVKPVCLKTYASRVFSLAGPTLSWIDCGWQAILGSVPGETCVSEDLRHWSVTPGRSTQAGLVEGDRSYWGQSLVSLCVWRPMPVECYSGQVHPSWIGRGWQVILGSIPGEPVCLKTYASEVLPLAGPPKLDWSRVTGHTGVSPWWSLCVWRTMPVECYPWQVHQSWTGRGWQAILGPVPGEACVSEDLCQWSVTPGRSTQAGLVEGDRPYWGQSLVKPVRLKTHVNGVSPLEGPPKPDWSRVTGHTGDSPWWSLCVWRPMPVECYPWEVHLSWIGRGWQARLGTVADPPGWGFSMGPTNPSLHRFPPGQSPLENEDFAVEEEFDDTGRWLWPKVNLNLKS